MDDDPIDTAWIEVEANWTDEGAHKRFLMLCQGLDRLSEAGTRYRAVKDADPERREVAEAQIDRLLGLAMQQLQVLKTEPKRRSGKMVLLLLAVGVSGSMIATALMLLSRMS
ncbi:MAG: hypothetical protein AB8I08_37445 [Sandaracinaceae bacterium]